MEGHVVLLCCFACSPAGPLFLLVSFLFFFFFLRSTNASAPVLLLSSTHRAFEKKKKKVAAGWLHLGKCRSCMFAFERKDLFLFDTAKFVFAVLLTAFSCIVTFSFSFSFHPPPVFLHSPFAMPFFFF